MKNLTIIEDSFIETCILKTTGFTYGNLVTLMREYELIKLLNKFTSKFEILSKAFEQLTFDFKKM